MNWCDLIASAMNVSMTLATLLQAISVIPADNMIRVAIRRALGYHHGYSHKTWIFLFRVALRPRIMPSARYIAPLAQSKISIVARRASWNEPYHYFGFRAPGAASVLTRRNPKGELPLCQAIFTAGSITHPAHSGYILFTNAIEGCYNWARIWPRLVALPRYH